MAGQPQGDSQAQAQLFKADPQQLLAVLDSLHGRLTSTLIAEPADLDCFGDLMPLLEDRAGRLLPNGSPH